MRFLSVLYLVILSAIPLFGWEADKMEANLKFLLNLREHSEYQNQVYFPAPIADSWADIGIIFDHELSTAEIAELEATGIIFKRSGGRVMNIGRCYSAYVPWNVISQLSDREDVVKLAANWHPDSVPCLDISNPEIQADSVWQMEDLSGLPVTGQGILIADFDTGIDIFHPVFFRLSGDTLEWLDTDNDGQFTPQIDAVDLNGNGTAEADETLDFIEGVIYDEASTFGGSGGISNQDDLYQPSWDWLYNDANNSAEREFGTSNGFTEDDLTYGELLFIAIDQNGNDQLDVGERLLSLGESKVYATFGWNNNTYFRGDNLIEFYPDYYGHGTAVCGILAGGSRGINRFTGIAPDADLIVGDFTMQDFFPFFNFLIENDCDILLFEFGAWTGFALDGSSYEEILINSMAELGILQITPSGNLNRGDKHFQTIATANDTVNIRFWAAEYNGNVPSYIRITVLWRIPDNNLTFGLILPDGYILWLTENFMSVIPYVFFTDRTTSLRGTAQFDVEILGVDLTGDWELFVDNNQSNDTEINGYIYNDAASWQGGAEWIDCFSNMKTVTWPATADSAFVLGSYSTRGYEQYIGVGSGSIQVGMISKFSGRGPRIDELNILSILSPGNYDVYTARSRFDYPDGFGGWRQFSGTSAAGPHIAGGAALLMQGLQNAAHYEIANILEENAFQDDFTGYTYNDSAGFGKVRLYDALYAAGIINQPNGVYSPQDFEMQVYPNPFNNTIKLEFHLPSSDDTVIKIFDILGREAAEVLHEWLTAGRHTRSLKVDNLASGIYFIRLECGEMNQTQKIVLIK